MARPPGWDRPRIAVDFNELPEADLVLLSQSDERTDSAGKRIALREGLRVAVYEDDPADDGTPDRLIADGVVERNSRTDWTAAAKWCCRIDRRGVRRASEER